MSFLFPILFTSIDGDATVALVNRLRLHDTKALMEIFDRYGRTIYSIIFRTVRDSAVAEDLTQEAFLRMWNRIQTFDPQKSQFAPWFLTIARNRALEYFRSSKNNPSQSSLECASSEHPELFSGIKDELFHSNLGEKLHSAFENLDPIQRQALELSYFEGLTPSDIAGKLTLPVENIRTSISSALAQLRAAIGRTVTEESSREPYELFVLGACEPSTASCIHLNQNNDPEVARQIQLSRELATGLAFIAPPVEPPARLKQRILVTFEPEPGGYPKRLWIWLSAIGLLGLVTFNFWQREQIKGRELAQARQELVTATNYLNTASPVMEFLNQPDVTVTPFGESTPTGPRGRVLLSPSKGVLLIISRLPVLVEGQSYQMWIMPSTGSPRPAGLFHVNAEQQAVHPFHQALNASEINSILISEEPLSGSTSPTQPVLLTIPIAH